MANIKRFLTIEVTSSGSSSGSHSLTSTALICVEDQACYVTIRILDQFTPQLRKCGTVGDTFSQKT